jgi:hypothetical protein
MRLAPPATPPYDPAPRPLIFLRGGMPIFNFHHLCKAVAKRAGLNPDHFWLHKFRATFATWHCGPGSISEQYRLGWAIQTSKARCDT